jgi:hypothetical protein
VVSENTAPNVCITSQCRGRFEREIQIEVSCQSVSNSEVEEGMYQNNFHGLINDIYFN